MSEWLALIIEDDPEIATIYFEAMQMAGYLPEVVGNGRLAVQRLQDVVPHLILLDLHLPGLSGRQVLQAIKATSALADTRIFLTTSDHLLAEELRNDVDLVLLKPISFTQLRDMAVRFRPASP